MAIRAGSEVAEQGARALYDVGCTAVLREVTPHDDGRFDVVTSDAVRFRLHGLDEAEVLAHQVAALFVGYRERLGTPRLDLPTSPRVLSYLVAADMLGDLEDRQRLLEQPDTAARLRGERVLLRRERVLLDALGAAPAADLAGGPVTAR